MTLRARTPQAKPGLPHSGAVSQDRVPAGHRGGRDRGAFDERTVELHARVRRNCARSGQHPVEVLDRVPRHVAMRNSL